MQILKMAHLKRGFLFITVSLIVLFSGWQISKSRTFQLVGEIIDRVETAEKLVALTFDDGPTRGYTQNVLDTLQAQGIRGTFFLVGSEMKRHPELTKLIVKSGHEVGNHSFSHSRMLFVSYEKVAREIETTTQLIREAGYEGEIRFRPPYGKKLFNLPRYLARNSIVTVTWDVEPETQVKADPDLIADYVVSNVRPGSVILLHVMFRRRSASMQSIPIFVHRLREQGYEFVTVSELLREAV